MPKIDWTPGRGRRGRPLRRVLGMGQKQGLVVMYGIAAVAVLFALFAAFGVFDSSGSPTAAPSPGAANTNADGSNAGGESAGPEDSSKAAHVLLASVQHYAGMLAAGQKIVGHTHYASIAAYGEAFTDPKSPAAALAKFRVSPNPEADTTYLDAESQAVAAYHGSRGHVFTTWLADMAKVKTDLGTWVVTANQFQQGSASQAALDKAAALVNQDLAAARADANSL